MGAYVHTQSQRNWRIAKHFAQLRSTRGSFENYGWRGNERPEFGSHKGPLMPHKGIGIFFPSFRHKEAIEGF